jgi:hypothetical protein
MKSGSQEWARCIQKMLDAHDLSDRGAAVKAGRPSLRTYIGEWKNGQIPQYKTAVDFLEHFPKEEAIECLQAAGYPIPDEWREEESPTPEQAIRDLRTTYDQLTDEQISYVEDLINEIKAERRRKYGKTE